MIRVLPLLDGRERVGAIVLCRDVSDLRSKERQLVTKDATIREIHHRVKNNLQTVAALLRMQARRMESPEAKVALNDAMSRVASIAIVHETLSQAFDETVEFDKVADGLLQDGRRRLLDLGRGDGRAAGHLRRGVGRHGDRAVDGGDRAVPERRRARAGRRVGRGAGAAQPPRRAGCGSRSATTAGACPPDFDWRQSRSLGLSIVNTLVAEMEGTFDDRPPARGPARHPGGLRDPGLRAARAPSTNKDAGRGLPASSVVR